jgi:response regulator of citrate/malate metabolism
MNDIRPVRGKGKVLQMSSAVKSAKPSVVARPRVLLVEDEPALVDILQRLVGDQADCQVIVASDLAEARRLMAAQPIELLLTDVHLPDGCGMSLLADFAQHHPTASAVVITGAPSMEGAINALRGGAVDFLPKPFSHDILLERVRKALQRQALRAKEESRFDRLRVAVKRLNASRRTISKKVDLLCNDLVTAYGEVSRQLDTVRTQEGFRKCVDAAGDLEQLLCHAMDWLLRQMGYANVAVWLTGEDGEFQLGAYMKYTLPGDASLTDAIKRVLLPMAVRDGQLRTTGDELQSKFTPAEMKQFKGQDILGVNCTYLGESLASIVFFRDVRTPFKKEDEAMLRSISAIFAVSLASIVREERGDEDGPRNDAEGGLAEPGEKPAKPADADWWKRGEPPPF